MKFALVMVVINLLSGQPRPPVFDKEWFDTYEDCTKKLPSQAMMAEKFNTDPKVPELALFSCVQLGPQGTGI